MKRSSQYFEAIIFSLKTYFWIGKHIQAGGQIMTQIRVRFPSFLKKYSLTFTAADSLKPNPVSGKTANAALWRHNLIIHWSVHAFDPGIL